MSNRMLYIYCEGHTEERVLKNFLRPYWMERFNHCDVIRYEGAGGLKVRFARDTNRTLTAEPESYVLCLVDLFREPFGVYNRIQMSHQDGFRAVQEQLQAQIEPDLLYRFGAFPIVMELETWLLADPNIQREINQSYPSPEDVEHPAKELEAWKSHYNKRIDGKLLFDKASAKRVYADNCPHFIQMIDWLTTEQPKPIPPEITQWYARHAELKAKRDEAIKKSENALQHNNLDEAIQWDEEREKWDQQLIEHAKTYSDNF